MSDIALVYWKKKTLLEVIIRYQSCAEEKMQRKTWMKCNYVPSKCTHKHAHALRRISSNALIHRQKLNLRRWLTLPPHFGSQQNSPFSHSLNPSFFLSVCLSVCLSFLLRHVFITRTHAHSHARSHTRHSGMCLISVLIAVPCLFVQRTAGWLLCECESNSLSPLSATQMPPYLRGIAMGSHLRAHIHMKEPKRRLSLARSTYAEPQGAGTYVPSKEIISAGCIVVDSTWKQQSLIEWCIVGRPTGAMWSLCTLGGTAQFKYPIRSLSRTIRKWFPSR